ncbi:MAG: ANTAR domain-containing protein [Moraxellaceae bacterium]|jgi:response regulator NasT|nr:ANTAR domain-containing protein [Moraxellaceae bacterium]HQV81143.1 ANTAR domain-containing protein [Agitococcus sp.]MBK7300158.1 ANTAR domain-containing protein [Moraxellaceae bacterium]MBK8327611.1 ANTAR domain-containing protein [Moraxellaceae bacterium]MBK9186685.1 ANTAR domain-containing protein [Moraxellaceae bacterium]
MLRVLLVNDTNKQVGSLRTALVQAGCDVVEEVSSALMIPKRVAELKADIVIIDTESPSRDVLEQICVMTQDAPRPIVMVSEDTQPAAIKAAIKAGVSAYVVEDIDAGRLSAVLEVAQARFEQDQALMSQIRQAESKLNERKIVERAKGLLMQLRSMTESEAYHAMRKMAMDRNIRIIDVAHKLLAMNELLA